MSPCFFTLPLWLESRRISLLWFFPINSWRHEYFNNDSSHYDALDYPLVSSHLPVIQAIPSRYYLSLWSMYPNGFILFNYKLRINSYVTAGFCLIFNAHLCWVVLHIFPGGFAVGSSTEQGVLSFWQVYTFYHLQVFAFPSLVHWNLFAWIIQRPL